MGSPGLPQSVLHAADVSSLSQLVLLERESRDLGRWSRMRACYHPGSRVRLSWFSGTGDEFVDASIEMARRGLQAQHRMGPPLVRIKAGRAVASASAIIDIPEKLGNTEVRLQSYALFLYRVEKREGRWGIMYFDAIYLHDELTSDIPGVPVPAVIEDLTQFRASYRMLSYMLSRKGYKASLPGSISRRPSRRSTPKSIPGPTSTLSTYVQTATVAIRMIAGSGGGRTARTYPGFMHA